MKAVKAVTVVVIVLAAWCSMAMSQTSSAPASQPAATATPVPVVVPPPVDPIEQWICQVKNPVPCFKWGADERIRENYTNDDRTLNNNLPNHEFHYQRYRTRLWTSFMPIENVEINARLVWEWFEYCQPMTGDKRATNFNEAIFDILNVKWKSICGLPATLTLGRQELIFGDGWLILDGTPLDGSRTLFFDAARLTYDMKDVQTTADLVFLMNRTQEDTWIKPFNYEPLLNHTEEEDNLGAFLWVANKSIDHTEIDGFFIYKHDEANLPHGNNSDIYTFGPRYVREFNDNWLLNSQGAVQVGTKNDRDLRTLGTRNELIYRFCDPCKNQLRWAFEYLSGDGNPHSGTDTGFDILWGRWPQFSEILANTWALEGGRPAQYTNMYRTGPGWDCAPTKNTSFYLNYNLLFANQNPFGNTASFSESGKFRGQLVTALLKYKFTEHIAGHLLGEFFAPGNYYSDFRNDVAVFARYEIVFTW